MKTIQFLLLLLVSSFTFAETTTGIYYGLYTDHLFTDDAYNENNDVVMFQYNDWYAGTMRNSFGNRSYIVAWSFIDYRKSWGKTYIELDAAVGGATGYADTPNFTVLGVAPAVIGSFDIGRSQRQFDYGIRTLYVPANVVNIGLFVNYKY